MTNPPSRRASDKALERRWIVGRRTILLGLTAGAALVAGLVFWRVGTGETTHDGAPAWSPDSKRIVFSVEQNNQTDLYVMNADGTGRRPLTNTAALESAPAFSPDGTRIAFETDRDGNAEIYTMDANGQNLRSVTNNPAADHTPAWSPDGRRIVFLSDRDRRPRSDVYSMAADGSDVQRLTTDGELWAPQYAPSGQLIAVQSGRDIETIELAGGSPKRLTTDPQNGMSPTWAPDGHRLAFASTRNARLELFTMAADGSNQELLLSMPGGSAMDPRWSPDGMHIAFVYVPHVESTGRTQPYAIYVLEVASRKVTRLSP